MRTIIHVIRLFMLALLVLPGSVPSSLAQEVSIPDPGLNAAIRAALQKPTGPLNEQDLLTLTRLDASNRNVSRTDGLEAARNLTFLNLFNNQLTNFALPNGFTNLTLLDLGFNALAQCSLQNGMTNLNTLFLEGNRLDNFTFPAGLTGLTNLDLSANGLSSLAFPADMTNVFNVLAFANQLTNVTFPPKLSRLNALVLDFNRLRSLNLPAGLTAFSRLTLNGNQMTNLNFPPNMTNLNFFDLRQNQLTSLTLPPDMTQLTAIFLDGNPLATLVLSEPLAATNLASTVASLRNQGVSVFTYPLAIRLLSPRRTVAGAFEFSLTGPPGSYTILSTTNLADWSEVGAVTNQLGSAVFTDTQANLSLQKFYRAILEP